MNEEKKKSSWLGPLGQELIETRPVGGRIPRNQFKEWINFKNFCNMGGLKLNPEGMIDLLQTYNKINKIIFPMARDYKLNPIEFKNDVLDIILKSLEDLSKSEWKHDSKVVQDKIKQKLGDAVKVSIS